MTIEGIVSNISFRPGPDKLFSVGILLDDALSQEFIVSADEDESRIVAPNGAQTNRYNLIADLAALDKPVRAVLHPSKDRYGLVLKGEFYVT